MIKRYGEAADQRRCAPHQLDRIQTTALDVLESLIEATYTRERKDHLRRPNLGIENLRFFFRLTVELHYLDRRRYEHAARTLDEIGRLVGGWAKAHATAKGFDGEAARTPLRPDCTLQVAQAAAERRALRPHVLGTPSRGQDRPLSRYGSGHWNGSTSMTKDKWNIDWFRAAMAAFRRRMN